MRPAACDLAIVIDGSVLWRSAAQAGFGTANELVGRDLALPGEILIAGCRLECLKKMTKQRLAEVKLGGNLTDRDSGLVDREGRRRRDQDQRI